MAQSEDSSIDLSRNSHAFWDIDASLPGESGSAYSLRYIGSMATRLADSKAM